MQAKILLLAGIGAQAVAAATTLDLTQASDCLTAVATIVKAVASLPTPTGDLAKYLNDAGNSKESDPCSWVASAPTSLASPMSSFSSVLSSVVSANSGAFNQLASCAAAVGGNSQAASLAPFMHITDCKAPLATGAAATSKSKNAAPAQTGIAAAAGVAAAALVGVAGLM